MLWRILSVLLLRNRILKFLETRNNIIVKFWKILIHKEIIIFVFEDKMWLKIVLIGMWLKVQCLEECVVVCLLLCELNCRLLFQAWRMNQLRENRWVIEIIKITSVIHAIWLISDVVLELRCFWVHFWVVVLS